MMKVSRVAFSIFCTLSFVSFLFSVYTILTSGMGITLWSDSISYLNTSLKLITEQGEASQGGRTILYPLFLAAFLGADPSYHPILLAQKGLFIVMSALTGLLCLRGACLMRSLPPASSSAALVILLIAQVSIQLNPSLLGLTHTLMPEPLFAFLVIVSATGLWVCFDSRQKPVVTVALISVTLCSFLLPMVKPHYLVSGLALPVLVSALLLPRIGWRATAIGFGVGCLLFLPVKLLDSSRHTATTGATVDLFGPATLFCNNANIIAASMEKGAPDPAHVQTILKHIVQDLPDGGWGILGFDGDACMYGEVPGLIAAAFAHDPQKMKDFYYQSFFTAAMTEPAQLSHRIFRQLYEISRRPVTNSYRVMTHDCSPLIRAAGQSPFYASLAQKCQNADNTRISFSFIRADLINALFVLLVVSALVRFGVKTLRGRFRNEVRRPGFLPLLSAMTALYGVYGLIAVVHSFDVPRYAAIMSPMVLAVIVAATLYLFSPAQTPDPDTRKGNALTDDPRNGQH